MDISHQTLQTTREIVPVPASQGGQALYNLRPAAMVHHAAEMATALAAVIEKQGLYTMIQGKKYVRIDGWATLGMMLGFLPREVEVKEMENGDYEATVELCNVNNGQIVGRASALCGKDERRWANADRYARRSMATTRATGKAYRLGFAWILALAGYESTPLEEVSSDSQGSPPRTLAGFDPENPKHANLLKTELEKRDIPDEYWESIGRQMAGKPSPLRGADIDEAIKRGVS